MNFLSTSKYRNRHMRGEKKRMTEEKEKEKRERKNAVNLKRTHAGKDDSDVR